MFASLMWASRAAHIEVTHKIDTDTFIQAFQRMIAIRENVRLIQSDNDINFLGAEIELKSIFLEINNKEISHRLQNQGDDWII